MQFRINYNALNVKHPAEAIILPDGLTLAARNDTRRTMRAALVEKRDAVRSINISDDAKKTLLQGELSYKTIIDVVDKQKVGDHVANAHQGFNKIINADENFVGIMVDLTRGGDAVIFSANAGNYKFKTNYGDNNHVIYTDWLVENFAERMKFCNENSAAKKSDWRFGAMTFAPYNGKNKTNVYGEIVQGAVFGKGSDFGLCRMYMYNIKTGAVKQLTDDNGNGDMSCAGWRDASSCAQCGLDSAANDLSGGSDLWGLVRRLAEQCVTK